VTHTGAIELLERTHAFPCYFTIKAIGSAADDFEGRIVRAAREALRRVVDMTHTVRVTPNGGHVAVTLEVHVETADEVIELYRAVQVERGLRFLI
jgi:putative lipoic acid-binding regulatory protein